MLKDCITNNFVELNENENMAINGGLDLTSPWDWGCAALKKATGFDLDKATDDYFNACWDFYGMIYEVATGTTSGWD